MLPFVQAIRVAACVTLLGATLWPATAAAQYPGTLVPPSIPASPQPRFPTPLPGSAPASPSPAPGLPPPGPPPASAPGLSSSPAASAQTERVTLTTVTERPEGAVLVVRDASGGERLLDVARYTVVMAPDASRATLADLRPGDRVEVTWFPEGVRRTLLTVRRVP